MVILLEYTDRTLDERRVEPDKRYEALLDELAGHLLKTEDLGEEMAERLEILETTSSDTRAKDAPESSSAAERVPSSVTAKSFAQIEASDYEASHAFLASHPEMLHERETDALLVDNIQTAVKDRNQALMRQYVHQLMVLQYCLAIEPSDFFEGVTVPGHGVQRAFQKDLGERLQVVWDMGTKRLTPAVLTGLAESGALEEMVRMLVETEEPGIEELVDLLGDVSPSLHPLEYTR
jgi:cell division cycle protein 37